MDQTASSLEDQQYDTKKEKSELLVRLDEMKRAIDGYKDYKSKSGLTDRSNTSINNSGSGGGKSQQLNITNQSFSQEQCFLADESISMDSAMMPTIEQAYVFNKQLKDENVAEDSQNLQKYLIITNDHKAQTKDIDLQCDLHLIQQQEMVQRHRQQLQHFEQALDILKSELDQQAAKEYHLKESLQSVQVELAQMRSVKIDQEKREEDLMKQTEELIMIVEDQTIELRERDKLIEHLQQIETNYYEGKNSSDQKNSKEQLAKLENKNHELTESIEDLKEKMAIEFNKKRILKQEYDDQASDLKEELQYYKDKYYEMKDLLSNCQEQLKHFEGLNEMRNSVIDKLETEIGDLKAVNTSKIHAYQSLPPLYQKSNQSFDMQNMILLQQTPQKHQEKSFSLNLQQVDCERSNLLNLSQISARNNHNGGVNDTAQKQLKAVFNQGTFSEVVSPKPSSLYGAKQNQDGGIFQYRNSSQDLMETNTTYKHGANHQMSRQEFTGSFNSTSSITQYDQIHQCKSQQMLSPLSAHYHKSSYSLQSVKESQKEQQYDSLMYSNINNKENLEQQKHKRYDNYYERVAQSDHKMQQSFESNERRRIEHTASKPFRVLSSENREYSKNDNTGKIIVQKKPFEYNSNNNHHSVERLTQKINKIESAKTHSSCTFAGQQSTTVKLNQNESFIDQNDSLNNSRMSQHKSSIRDEIKKLHNNINSLRQKMNVNNNKQPKNNSEMPINNNSESLSMKYTQIRASRDSSPGFDMIEQ